MSFIDPTAGLFAVLGHPRRAGVGARTVLVCLPTGATRSHRAFYTHLAAQVGSRLDAASAALCPAHLHAQAGLTQVEEALLVGAEPDHGPLRGCVAGPIGLLDITAAATVIRHAAADLHAHWSAIVAGTPTARPLRAFLDHHPDHAAGARQAMAAFAAQPRIAAMAAAHRRGEATFLPDEYGPTLHAYQAGADVFADYLVDLMQLGDALLTLDGVLLQPTTAGPRITHRLTERRRYHQAARAALRAADPTTVLAACHLAPPPAPPR